MLQFTCTNLDGSQKEGVTFKFASERGGSQKRGGGGWWWGVLPQKTGGSKPGGNYDYKAWSYKKKSTKRLKHT